MFLPATQKEMAALGWDALDMILITGDSYVDSPYIGVAVIGKVLVDAGYRVGIIAQPDISSDKDICRLGEPELFWGVSAGCMDSMVANYTATLKRRKSDNLTAGGKNTKRPDRAVIAYTNLIRQYFKKTKSIVIGGIEASLRRISHYDYNSNAVRRSVLFDAKADILVYGMGEKAILEIAEHLKDSKPIHDIRNIRGICYIAKEKPAGHIELPSHAEVAKNKTAFKNMFLQFYKNADPMSAKGLCQLQDTRYLIQTPPQFPLTTDELDHIHELGFEQDVHPAHRKDGVVNALDTIRFSINTHRGCFGECHFCAITIHQGRIISNRSEASILKEAASFTKHAEFKGIIRDAGGPTANMYGMECEHIKKQGACPDKSCLFPAPCRKLPISHKRQIRLLQQLRQLPGVKKIFIGSGIRHDLILCDKKYGQKYLRELISHHISGQLKIAPEHTEDHVLALMGKPKANAFAKFVSLFDQTTKNLGNKQFLTCYFIAAYPGCAMKDMQNLKQFIRKVLRFTPEQIQVFTPTPSTMATLMYYTEKDTFTGKHIFVEKDSAKKEKQKKILKGNRSFRKK